MTKYEFKRQLEELLFEYLHDNQDKKDLPYNINFEYIREEPSKNSYGHLIFRNEKKDVSFQIKPIIYKDENQYDR